LQRKIEYIEMVEQEVAYPFMKVRQTRLKEPLGQ